MMGGHYIFQGLGVGADWVVGNLFRRLLKKPTKTYRDIWDSVETSSNAWYDTFYWVLGAITLFALLALAGWITMITS
jgi:hypothetical protein